MYTRHLREHVVTHNRLIGRHTDTAETLHHTRQVVELTFHNMSLGMELVFQNGLHGCHRRISTALP